MAGESFYIPLGHTNAKTQLAAKDVFAALAPVFTNTEIKKYVYDLKTALVSLENLEVQVWR
ncbi:MAG: hypothetical protein MZV70_25260 [Desulfobacterales bacterium]|nr:hypothetical protein [Desulfobacterales bacterium]